MLGIDQWQLIHSLFVYITARSNVSYLLYNLYVYLCICFYRGWEGYMMGIGIPTHWSAAKIYKKHDFWFSTSGNPTWTLHKAWPSFMKIRRWRFKAWVFDLGFNLLMLCCVLCAVLYVIDWMWGSFYYGWMWCLGDVAVMSVMWVQVLGLLELNYHPSVRYSRAPFKRSDSK